MRKLMVTNIVSLDGYHEGPEGIMQLPMDDAFDAHNLERLEAADTLLLGATTFRGFQGFWPSVADDPSFSDNNRGISRRNNEIAKVVISDWSRTIFSTPGERRRPWFRARRRGVPSRS